MKLSFAEEQLILKYRKEQELKVVKEWQPKDAADIPAQEKCEAFDRLHKMALDHFNLVAQEGYQDNDDKQWMYEAVMLLLGKDVFNIMNKLDSLK